MAGVPQTLMNATILRSFLARGLVPVARNAVASGKYEFSEHLSLVLHDRNLYQLAAQFYILNIKTLYVFYFGPRAHVECHTTECLFYVLYYRPAAVVIVEATFNKLINFRL